MPAVLDKAGEHSFVAAFEERPVVVDLGANRGPELDGIDQISVEFHDFVDPALRPRVRTAVARLKRAGYGCYCWSTNYMHGSPYADCLFYRRLPRIVRVLRRRRWRPRCGCPGSLPFGS